MGNKASADQFYKKAKENGYRARSAFKLLQIHEKFNIFQFNKYKKMKIIDLGAHPGSFLQAILWLYENSNQRCALEMLGIDMRTIKPLENKFEDKIKIELHRGDIFSEETFDKIVDFSLFDVLLSDLAPKTGGSYKDIAIQEEMVEFALKMAVEYLSPQGFCVIKVFQSPETQKLMKKFRYSFQYLKLTKPKASKQKSKEMYIIGKK